ncbi:MAG: type II toxin-antitoxin system ParD family antitoxin [Bdellovibrionales bacterium]
MNINLPPVDEQFVKMKVEQGYYSNVTEVVRDAVRRMREQDPDSVNPRLMAALQKGLDDVKKGKGVPYDKKFWPNLERKVRSRIASGKPMKYDPDVIGPGDEEPWGGK